MCNVLIGGYNWLFQHGDHWNLGLCRFQESQPIKWDLKSTLLFMLI